MYDCVHAYGMPEHYTPQATTSTYPKRTGNTTTEVDTGEEYILQHHLTGNEVAEGCDATGQYGTPRHINKGH